MSLLLNDGNSMPRIGFGTYKTDNVQEVVTQAIDNGYRLFDCARVYHNEHLIGSAFETAFQQNKVKRKDLFIVSKVWLNSLSPGLPTKSAEKSVSDLRCNYLDLLLIHWPIVFKECSEDFPLDSSGKVIFDLNIKLEDIWKEFIEIRKSGLVKSIGVSNFNAEQLQTIMSCGERPAVNQIESHVLFNNQSLIDFCHSKGIAVMAYCPLGRCLPLAVPKIQELSSKYKVTSAQICLKFLLNKGIVVIPKSSSVDRMKQNLDLFGFDLTEEDIQQIQELNKNIRIAKFDKYGCLDHPGHPFRQ